VLGQSFEHKVLLAAVEPLDEPALLRDVDRAIAAQVLVEVAGGYAFRHALVREAVYWDLTAPRRMLLHARVGELLEQLHAPRADDYSAELAYHFAHAGEASQVRAKALHYCLQAGRQANFLSSNRQALAHFTRALQLIETGRSLTEPLARVEALEGRGYAERGLGLLPEAVASFRSVLDLTDDVVTRARVRGEIASALLHNDPTGALAEARAGLAELGSAGEATTVAAIRLRVQSFEAMYWFLAGRYEKVRALGEQMIPVAVSLGDSRALSRARAVVSWALLGSGRLTEAIRESEQLLAAAESTGDKSEIAHAEVDLGLETYLHGSFSEARLHLERAVVLYSESANDVWMANTLQLLARVSLGEGDLKNARVRAESALAFALGHQERWAAECYDVLGSVHTLAAEYEAALVSFTDALRIRRRIGHAAGVVDSLVGLGRVHELRGDSRRAESLYAEAVDASGDLDLCPSVVASWRHLGRIHCVVGDTTRANSVLEHAVEIASAVSETIEYAPTLLALAQARAASGDLDAAVSLVDRALLHGSTVEFSVEAHVTASELLRKTDQCESAAQQAAAALNLADVFSAPWLVGLANLAVARVSGSRGDAARAVRHYKLAVHHFARAGTREHSAAQSELVSLIEAHPDLA
jgi:tetratricopeptide (TPR) repeat protein